MDISVIILSWNDSRYLEECLMSLPKPTGGRLREIIVVDNASTDGTPEMAEKRFPYIKMIRNRENLGFPKGNNVGISAATGSYLCLLNSDVKLSAACLETLAKYMDEHQDIGIIGPRILNADGSHQSSCRSFPSLWNNFCSIIGLTRLFKKSRFFSGEHMFYFKGDQTRDVDVLVGCFWLVRREALNQFGLLDEQFFMYAEDVDWCKRCWDSGWRVTFHPASDAIHYRGGSSAKSDPVKLAVTQQRSVLRYWKKHHGLYGLAGISALMALQKTGRALVAAMSLVTSPRETRKFERLRVNGACLWDLLPFTQKSV
jgi:GT2 family glycosyltransferase